MSAKYSTVLTENANSNIRVLANSISFQNWGASLPSTNLLSDVLAANNHNTVLTIEKGNVGIGTSTPRFKMDVKGDVNIEGNFFKNGTIVPDSWIPNGNTLELGAQSNVNIFGNATVGQELVTKNLTVTGQYFIANDNDLIRNRLALAPIRYSERIKVAEKSVFVFTQNGRYRGDELSTEVFINGVKLAYESPTVKDFTVAYGNPNRTTTEYTVTLAYPVMYGDVVDISVWPTYITDVSVMMPGYVYQQIGDGWDIHTPDITYEVGNVGIGTYTPTYQFQTKCDSEVNNTISRMFLPTLGTTANSAIDVCGITCASGAFVVTLDVVHSDAGFSGAKHYVAAVGYNETNGEWRRMMPLSSSGDFNGNDFAVDIKVTNAEGLIRIVRLTGTSTNNYSCRVQVTQSSTDEIMFMDVGTYYPTATNTGVYKGNPITQVDGNVGVGTMLPQAFLHVVGPTDTVMRLGGDVNRLQGVEWHDTALRSRIYKPANSTDLRIADASTDRITIQNGVGARVTGKLYVADSSSSAGSRPTSGIYVQNDYNFGMELQNQNSTWNTTFITRSTDGGFAFKKNTGSLMAYINLDGNVGIGTSSPEARLHTYVGSQASTIRIQGDATQNKSLELHDASATWQVYRPANTSELRFHDGSADRMRLLSGMGTIVNGTLQTVGRCYVEDNSSAGGTRPAQGFYVWSDFNFGMELQSESGTWNTTFVTRNSDGGFAFKKSDGTNMVYINNGGNVGIGSTSATALLNVRKDQNDRTAIVVDNIDATSTGALAEVRARNTLGSMFGSTRIASFGSNYTTSGPAVRNGGLLEAEEALVGGLSIAARNPTGGNIRFYTGGVSERMRIDTRGFVAVGSSTAFGRFTVNNEVIDRFTFDHSGAPVTITNQTPTSATVLNDPQPIIHLCRQGTAGASYGARATLALSRYENSMTNSRTRLDIQLAHDSYDTVTPLSIQSNGNVGIGTTTPLTAFHVNYSASNAMPSQSGIYLLNPLNSSGQDAVIAARVAGSSAGNPYISLDVSGESGWSIGVENQDANKFKIKRTWWHSANTTDNTFVINSVGNVGIGKSDPSTLLDVNGVVTATSFTGTLDVANLSGTLGVGKGGTGATTLSGFVFGNGTSAFTAIGSTGSGNVVLATSPSIASPTLTGTTTAATLNATTLSGNGASITNIVATNIATGLLPVARGGTGAGTLSGFVFGNGTNAFTAVGSTGTGNVVLSAGPTLTGTTTVATLSATTISGDGASITNINAGNIASGTLPVARGGTGTTTSTGSGNVVLSAGPTLSGTTTVATLSGTSVGATNITAGGSGSTQVLLTDKEIKLLSAGYAHYSIFNENGEFTFRNTSTSGVTGTAGTKLVMIDSSGNLKCAGNIYAYSSLSDARLKTDVANLSSTIETIKQLRPVSYKWRDDVFFQEMRGKEDAGLIAQEVAEVLPSVVHDHDVPGHEKERYKGIRYEKLVPFLIKAVQELSEQNKALQDRLSMIESKIGL
jgi:hypothetical protein